MLMYQELDLVWFGKQIVTFKINSSDSVMPLYCQNLLINPTSYPQMWTLTLQI